MLLKVKVKELKPETDLSHKLLSLGVSGFLERILIDVNILSQENKILLNTKALIDTGAVFSLFPRDLKDDFIHIKTFKHRLWGIINDEICKINVDIGVVPIRLIDDQKIKSPIINVTAAFAHTTQVPVLLGMKGFLYEFNYSFNRKAKEFIIEFS